MPSHKTTSFRAALIRVDRALIFCFTAPTATGSPCRSMPELIYEGHVYIAMPPLYKAMPTKGEEEYLYDDKALEKYRKRHKGPFTLQRYKGLGEMDAEQLWETTLNPETRLLKLVEIEDARMASEVTEMLMGTEVPPRKAFIYEHATDAELDI